MPLAESAEASVQSAQASAWLEDVTMVNKEVGTLLHDMQDNRQIRSIYYEDLRDRMLRIKGYARSCYGLKSNEYKELTALGRF